MNCGCGRPVHDAFLCSSCTLDLAADLRSLAVLVGMLVDTYSRQDTPGRQDGGRAGGFDEAPLPYREGAAFLLARCDARALSGVRRVVARVGRSEAPESLAARYRWLGGHVHDLAQSSGSVEWADLIAALCVEIVAAVDHPPTPVYLGACDVCASPMYAARGGQVHSCTGPGCTRVYEVAARLAELRDRSRAVIAPASTICTALTSMDQPVTEGQIRKWRQRGRLAPSRVVHRAGGGHDQPWYRLGDVIDLLDHERDLHRRE